MPFHAEPIETTVLRSLEEVGDWISDTQRHLTRVPVAGVLEQGATLRDDSYLGDGDALLHFNQAGYEALCQSIGCRPSLMERLETPGLVSDVLNDLLAQREVRQRLDDVEFVIDDRHATVIGMVSKTYVTYSNHDFLADITRRIEALGQNDGFEFHEGYGINTALKCRFVSTRLHGVIEGRGGVGADKSKLGLDFVNSMVGNSAVRLNYYLLRLVCANGLMLPAAESVNRVFHSGRKDTFQQRMDRCFAEVVRNIDQLQGLLEALGSMPFAPGRLAQDPTVTEQIFNVIPKSKQAICDSEDIFLRYSKDATSREREEQRRAHDARLIGLIPKHFRGGLAGNVFATSWRDSATLFDFINLFTAFAKEQRPAQQLEIEERAGGLAKYLATNARRL